jgi:hypothetical protein
MSSLPVGGGRKQPEISVLLERESSEGRMSLPAAAVNPGAPKFTNPFRRA